VTKILPSIGVLDSGIGGLSVLREIHNLLPHHPTVYFADQFHLPYGPRPIAELNRYIEEITRFLMKQGCSVIVLACHTASAAGLEALRTKFPDIPFVGMEPAIKPAIEATRTGVVGVLSTQTTAEGTPYKRLLGRYAAHARVITQVAPDLVRVAEKQLQNTDEGKAIIRACVGPLIDAGADQIVLACTHFSFLVDVIQEMVGKHIRLVDPSLAVARQVARIWPNGIPVSPMDNVYVTSGNSGEFQRILNKLLGIKTTAQYAYWREDHTLFV
jgi:glutamate racemase